MVDLLKWAIIEYNVYSRENNNYEITFIPSFLGDAIEPERGLFMITIITGASHTGKTALAHRLMIKTQTSYLSIDHLKMGLIRAGITDISVEDDAVLESYLWPIVTEIIKTAIENKQKLIVEGIYVPENWISSFDDSELQHIQYTCLVMSEKYIRSNFESIKNHANVIESRLETALEMEDLIQDNLKFLDICENNLYPYIYIDGDYYIDIDALIS